MKVGDRVRFVGGDFKEWGAGTVFPDAPDEDPRIELRVRFDAFGVYFSETDCYAIYHHDFAFARLVENGIERAIKRL